jgi:D-hydroxyproline dehydrogenase subunit gamma
MLSAAGLHDIQNCTHSVEASFQAIFSPPSAPLGDPRADPRAILDGGRIVNRNLSIIVNGTPHQVPDGATVAVALLQVNASSRLSVCGEPRQPMCGMGICYECRVTIDGQRHQRSCQILCRPGMRVVTE